MKRTSLARQRTGPGPSETYSLSEAKAYLGRLLQKTETGKTVYIRRGQKRFLLQFVPAVEPIPLRPPGFFQFDDEDVQLDKKFSSANVIPQTDLESDLTWASSRLCDAAKSPEKSSRAFVCPFEETEYLDGVAPVRK